nr:phenylalanine--tRNA ligase subunit alpha [Candidatus Microthrix sp.]
MTVEATQIAATRIAEAGVEAVGAVATLAELTALETTLLGKKSELSMARRSLGSLEPDQRREAGAAFNATREALGAAIEARRSELAAAEHRASMEAEALDLTRFVGPVDRGHVHPVTATRERLEDIFIGLGFEVAEGPDLETDWFNFGALNIPPHHPARGMHDTFHLDLGGLGDYVLRTHTSPVQIRHMRAVTAERGGPPIYAIMPGRVYRNERTDATHLAALHQLEGLVIDRDITLGHLAGTIDTFIKTYFGTEFETRFRPSYFPLYRAVGRGGHANRRRRLAGDRRLRHGAPDRPAQRGDRPRDLVRLRLWLWHRPAGENAPRRARHPRVRRQRRALPVSVLILASAVVTHAESLTRPHPGVGRCVAGPPVTLIDPTTRNAAVNLWGSRVHDVDTGVN